MKLLSVISLSLVLLSCAPPTSSSAAGGGSGPTAGGGTETDMAGAGGGGGGGGGPTVPPDWVSGSRLRARVQTTEDGGKSFVGWYDSMLKLTCTFQVAADGQQRCLPQSGPYATIGVYYSDTNCSIPLAAEIATWGMGCQPSYATRAETTTPAVCSDYGIPMLKTHVYPITSKFTGSMVYSFVSMNGTPTCTGAAPSTVYVYYQVGSEVDPTMFVVGSVVTE